MNILILANKPPYPAKDGSSLATLNLALGFARSGNSVKILAFSTQKHKSNLEAIPTELRFLIDFEFVNINTTINPLKGLLNLLFSKFPYNIERFNSKKFSTVLSEVISQNRFDVIQIEGLSLYPYLRNISKLTKTPIAYRSHNVEHEIWERISKNEKNPIKAKYFSILSKRIHRLELNLTDKVDALVSISNRDECWFIKNGFNKPSTTIPMGYSLPAINSLNGIENNDICYLGSLDWIPNQEGLNWFLKEVWPAVRKLDPKIKFNVAGRNTPDFIVAKLRLEPNVVFHGEVESAQAYLSNYSIVVVPILSGSGMRVKIVEGMMLGKAIITTTIGLEGILAKNREHLIIADKPLDFVNAIIELIQHPDVRTSIIEKARNFAMANFDNDNLTEELIDFYKKLI